MDYYVYAWLDTRKKGKFKYRGINHTFDHEPYYIGKGRDRRCRHHLYSNRNLKKYNRSKKILEETGFDPKIVILKSGMSSDEAFSFEKKVIKAIGREINEGSLTNLTDGGDGGSGYKHTEKHKRKISKILKGRKHSWGDKISKSLTGKAKTESHKNNLWKTRDRVMPEKVRTKIKKTMKSRVKNGEVFTESHRKKISKSVSGSKHPMYGLSHKQETKNKMSETRKKIMPDRIKKLIDEMVGKGIKVGEGTYNEYRKTGLPKWCNLSKYLDCKTLIRIGAR